MLGRSDHFECCATTVHNITTIAKSGLKYRFGFSKCSRLNLLAIYSLDLISASIHGRYPKALFRAGTSDKNEHLSTSGLESTGGSAQVCTVSCQINGSKMARSIPLSLSFRRESGRGKKRTRVADKTSACSVSFATVCRAMCVHIQCQA